MANRNIAATTVLLLATFQGATVASAAVTPVAGVARVRLHVAGIV